MHCPRGEGRVRPQREGERWIVHSQPRNHLGNAAELRGRWCCEEREENPSIEPAAELPIIYI